MSDTLEHRPHPPYPPRPPRPPYPPIPPYERKKINGVLTREIRGILYDVMVMTRTSNVYNDKYTKTLTEILDELAEAITSATQDLSELSDEVRAIVEDAPDIMNSFKEVWAYVNLDEGDPKSRIAEALGEKVDKEEGKGLSTHDLTDVLYEKLVNDYSKEELDEKFQFIIDDVDGKISVVEREVEELDARVLELEQAVNMPLTDSDENPPKLKEGDVYAKIVSRDQI